MKYVRVITLLCILAMSARAEMADILHEDEGITIDQEKAMPTMEATADRDIEGDYTPLLDIGEPAPQPDEPETPSVQQGFRMPTLYRILIYQKLDIGARFLQHELKNPDKGQPFEDSFIGSIDQLRIVSDAGPRYHLVFRYAPIPYAGIGYQTDRLEIRTQTSMPPERRVDDRDTDGNLIMDATLPFVFVRYNILGWVEPYAEYGRARYRNSFDPDPRWFAEGRRNFLVEDSETRYWGFGLSLVIKKHILLDFYWRNIDVDVDGIYVFRGDDRPDEPFIFTTQHKAYGFTAGVRF